MNPRYMVRATFPPHMLTDLALRTNGVPSVLTNCAHQVDDFPHARPFHITNIRYGAFVVPHDPMNSAAWSHALDGTLVPAEELDDLLGRLADAAGEINGVWAISAWGDVVFDDEEPS